MVHQQSGISGAPVITENGANDFQERALAVGTAAPKNEENLFDGASGQRVADRALQEPHQFRILLKNSPQEFLENGTTGLRIIFNWDNFCAEVLSPMVHQFASSQVDCAVFTVK